jgi:glycosyltransferase involved in cell wall biosynthesis
MRVLHVTEALGGGVQSALANYVGGLPDVEHALYSRERSGQGTYDWPIPVEEERYRGGLAGFFVRLLAKVREERPDVVHLHSSFAGAARALLPRGQAVVYSPHCYAMERRDCPALVRAGYAVVEYLLARRRQAVVAVSLREAAISARLNPRTPTEVALNPAPFVPPRNRSGRRTAEVVMVGRISAQKDPHLFAEVARASRGRPWRFAWIGDGDREERADLERAGVAVTGWAPPSRVLERVSRAGLYLHTAAWEGGPIATVEAATLGVPVLSRDIPSMSSLGYPVAGDAPHELARAVRDFFENPTFAAEVRRRSATVAAAASRSSMSAAVRDAYAEALEAAG